MTDRTDRDSLKFALLIDGDNVSSRYIAPMIKELSIKGAVIYRRVYGDWTNSRMAGWKDVLFEYSLSPMQQFPNVSHKNATDSALIIDAMDILYGQIVDGFCLVSSDSDFTRLAARLRESDKVVIGIGNKKTPMPLRKACNEFIFLENISANDADNMEAIQDSDSAAENDDDVAVTTTIKELESDIVSIIQNNYNKGNYTLLSELGTRLKQIHSDFDVRNYGYASLKKFIKNKFGALIVEDNDAVQIKQNPDEIKIYIKNLIKSNKNGILLTDINVEIQKKYRDFKAKDHGYNTFKTYIDGIEGVTVKKSENGLMAVGE